MTQPQPPHQFQPPYPPQFQPPVKKSHTVRNVIVGMVVGGFLLIGGCTALVAISANEAGKALAESTTAPTTGAEP